MSGSVYSPLADFLHAHASDTWEAGFEEIERVLRRRLPSSAYRHQAWWANQSGAGHSQTQGWRSAGWRTTKLDLERQRVRFERDPGLRRKVRGSDENLWAQARELTGIEDRNQLIEEGLRALIAREATERLIGLGGSMPDFTAPARERPLA